MGFIDEEPPTVEANRGWSVGGASLVEAVRAGHTREARRILHQGLASVDQLQLQGASALTFAAARGDVEMARALLEYGVLCRDSHSPRPQFTGLGQF